MKFMKQYILIGGSTGIGLEVAKELLDKGNRVHVMSRAKGRLPDHENLHHWRVDVTSENPEFPKFKEPVDGLVYFPGNINLKPFRGLKPDVFRDDFELNAIGLVKSLQAYFTNLNKADQASIVAFSTVAVQTGMAYHASVAAAKGAVEGIVRSLSAEFAPKIRVNAVAPSLTETSLSEGFLDSEQKKENSMKRHPLGRYGQPQDLASAVLFLLGEESSWITGQVLHVDGGLSVVSKL